MYSFNTSIAGPSSPPGNVMVTKIGSTFVEVVWSEPDLSGHNGVIRSYTLLINEVQGARETSFNFTSTSTQATVTNLHPFYMYNISVAAVTTSPGPYSIQVAVTTLQDGVYVQ